MGGEEGSVNWSARGPDGLPGVLLVSARSCALLLLGGRALDLNLDGDGGLELIAGVLLGRRGRRREGRHHEDPHLHRYPRQKIDCHVHGRFLLYIYNLIIALLT